MIPPNNRKSAFWWFTWGTQPPTFEDYTITWMPAYVRDGKFIPLGNVDFAGNIQPRRNENRAWISISATSPDQWGEEIKK